MEPNKQYICDTLELSEYSEIEYFPLYVQIETTARCNSKCVMCPRSKELPSRRQWDMSRELMDKLINELTQYSDHIRRVIPQGYGEPLLDPNLFYFINKLKKCGIREVFISSNGSLLDEKRSHLLIESGLDQIDFSVDAFNGETYEKIRKGLCYEIVMENIKRFIKIRDKLGGKTRIRFRYVIQEGINEKEYGGFCNYWQSHIGEKDMISGKKIHTFGGNMAMPDRKEYNELKDKLLSLPCKGIFGTISVLSDGTMPICGVDVNQNHIAGDANISSLQSVWQGELFTTFRNNHLKAGRVSYPHCPSCNSWAPELKLPEALSLGSKQNV
ncbi:MAG: radical SAM protein [Proteobacteria bacterium]|nr:radical SAM protein [Desulfobacula sp.]MBU4130707.1 radical SAM protein [Pseudomonadota bacterium]